MKSLYKIALIAMAAIFAASCDLTEHSIDQQAPQTVFQDDLAITEVMNSLYMLLPSMSTIYEKEPGDVDYVVSPTAFDSRFKTGFDSQTCSQSISFGDIRDANYVIENLMKYHDASTATTKAYRDNFVGQARFIRAYNYFSLLAKYGDIQWYDKTIALDDKDLLYKDRDSRDVVVKHIIEDLDFGYEHITHDSPDNTTIDKWCAMFLKMRVCLFEAAWRKYHNCDNYSNYKAADLYKLAAEAAEEIMDSHEFSLIDDYADVFQRKMEDDPSESNPPVEECILWAGRTDDVNGSQNYYFGYQNNHSLCRTFVNTFLMKDGTPFTDKADYSLIEFKDEFNDRDPRMGVIVMNPSYIKKPHKKGPTKDKEKMVPNISGNVAPLGYEVVKFSLPEYLEKTHTPASESKKNTNGVPVFRYAEVLLSYAEAEAELGVNAESWWSKTIGALRTRAGFTNTGLPSGRDEYLRTNFYPSISDAVLLEVRRERACELCLEGLRENDLKRWNCYQLVCNLPWNGAHIPALGQDIDFDGNGTADFYFAESKIDGLKGEFVKVNVGKADNEQLCAVANAKGGYDLYINALPTNRQWNEDGRQYLYPIPYTSIEEYKFYGYTLTQNPGY